MVVNPDPFTEPDVIADIQKPRILDSHARLANQPATHVSTKST
jgi:hypothetical protein